MHVSNIKEVHCNKLSHLCSNYNEVFEPAISVMKDFKASAFLKSSATPKYLKSRQILFAQKDLFKAEADNLTQDRMVSGARKKYAYFQR